MRAGILPASRLKEYCHSSYPYLWRPGSRPKFLQLHEALLGAGGLPDTPQGWSSYAAYLEWQAAEGPAGKSKAYVNLSQGWALGGSAFKAVLLRDHAVAAETRAWEAQGAREIRELRWHAGLARALEAVGRAPEDLFRSPKSAPWKLAIAACLKDRTQASNLWLSHHLNLGARAAFSSNLSRYRRLFQPTDPLWRKLTKIFAA